MEGLINFHILFLVPKHDDDDLNVCLGLQKVLFDEVLSEWKRNFGSRKFPDYKPLCSYVRKVVHGRLRTNFDLHYVNPVLSSGAESDVSFYVLKYMLKPSDRAIRLQQALKLNLPEDEFVDIWKLVRCRHFESEGLGLGTSRYVSDNGHRNYVIPDKVLSHLRRGIDLSKRKQDEPIPFFFSPIDGSSSPLAKYYKSKGEVFNQQDFLDFFYASKKIGADNVVIKDDIDVCQTDIQIDKFEKNVALVDFNSTANELDDLFDSDFDNFLDF